MKTLGCRVLLAFQYAVLKMIPDPFFIVLALLGTGAVAEAQTKPAPAKWSAPRTPDGQPDLQGVWTNATITPLERPAAMAGKAFLTEAEVAAIEQRTADNRAATDKMGPLASGSYNRFWYDDGTTVLSTRQTSLWSIRPTAACRSGRPPKPDETTTRRAMATATSS